MDAVELLFTLDQADYTPDLPRICRCAVRGLIRRGDRWLMQRALDGVYKVPGGGMEPGETQLDTLSREVREETGMQVLQSSARAIGEVVEVRRDRRSGDHIFEQHSYYYFCEAIDTGSAPALTAKEQSWGLTPVWVTLTEAIDANLTAQARPWVDRDTQFLKFLRGLEEKEGLT